MAPFGLPPNPFVGQLADLDSVLGGSRKGLDRIYHDMQVGLGQFGKRLDYLDRSTAKSTRNRFGWLDEALAGFNRQSAADVVQTALASGGPIGDTEQRDLQRLATESGNLYQGYGRQLGQAAQGRQTSLRGLDKQYIKDLKASAVKEKLARSAELEQNALGLSAGLQSQGAMWDAQAAQLGMQQGIINSGQGNAGLSGRESPNTANAARFAAQQWGIQVGGWRAKGSVPNSDHPKGLADDFMIRSAAQGGQIAAYFQANAAQWGVKYIIWDRMINTLDGRGWRPYTGPNPHTDHVHVSFRY
jgi:hypothetical protein